MSDLLEKSLSVHTDGPSPFPGPPTPVLNIRVEACCFVFVGAQAHTELADSPGLRFRDECLTLVAEARYGELLERWLGQFELLLSKAQDKGASSAAGPRTLRACGPFRTSPLLP